MAQAQRAFQDFNQLLRFLVFRQDQKAQIARADERSAESSVAAVANQVARLGHAPVGNSLPELQAQLAELSAAENTRQELAPLQLAVAERGGVAPAGADAPALRNILAGQQAGRGVAGLREGIRLGGELDAAVASGQDRGFIGQSVQDRLTGSDPVGLDQVFTPGQISPEDFRASVGTTPAELGRSEAAASTAQGLSRDIRQEFQQRPVSEQVDPRSVAGQTRAALSGVPDLDPATMTSMVQANRRGARSFAAGGVPTAEERLALVGDEAEERGFRSATGGERVRGPIRDTERTDRQTERFETRLEDAAQAAATAIGEAFEETTRTTGATMADVLPALGIAPESMAQVAEAFGLGGENAGARPRTFIDLSQDPERHKIFMERASSRLSDWMIGLNATRRGREVLLALQEGPLGTSELFQMAETKADLLGRAPAGDR